jgi:glycosyltransferase involved in cell wall biosynthesis
MTVLILTEGELTRDPRARRAALAGGALGVEVVGLCPMTRSEPAALDGVRVVRAGSAAGDGTNVRQLVGALRRERPLLRELRGLWRLGRLVRLTFTLARAARELGPVHVVHANDLDTLVAGWWIARRDRARLVYDAHELYTSQEPDPPLVHRAVSGWLERSLGRRADAVVTVNEQIAEELERRLRLATRPTVVLNCPPVEDSPEPHPQPGCVSAVYQGAMGPGRFTDDLLIAAASAPRLHLTMRVAGADIESLQTEVARRGLEDRVRVVPPVPPDQLVSALAGFDVGLIINRPVTLNDELVLPNKLFEYLMAGLAVVAPRLPALTPVLDGIGATFTPADPQDMGLALERLADDAPLLLSLRLEARARARSEYNAERQTGVLASAWGL